MGSVIAMLQLVDAAVEKMQGLVLCPTRELALEVRQTVKGVAACMQTKVLAITGGTMIRQNIVDLKEGAHILIGTPGRTLDLIKRGYLKLDDISLLILDEVDELLSRGFKEYVEEIIGLLSPQVQIGFFSSTVPKEMLDIVEQFVKDPVKILVKCESRTLDGVRQYFAVAEEENQKLNILLDICQEQKMNQTIVYCNNIRRIQSLAEAIGKNNIPTGVLHGEMSMAERLEATKEFRAGTLRVLVCSDLCVQNTLINQVSLVINYELPKTKEGYLARGGHSGKYGRKGTIVNLAYHSEVLYVKEIQDFYETEIFLLPADLSSLC
eukprot:TRINITY_DN7116_c0_g1_i2.p1 TRINITY_DN7116_c0_g1~~TRINITY_DN7116_c0_g1_i2.p1  ORF type:complete len:323 (+),score=23.36 TRINITY_DN7116_c0_g1_i2:376-1344(+)